MRKQEAISTSLVRHCEYPTQPPEVVVDRTLVYAHLEFRGCFTPAPLCKRSSEGQVTLCVSHSHMISLRGRREGEGTCQEISSGRGKKKKKIQQTLL